MADTAPKIVILSNCQTYVKFRAEGPSTELMNAELYLESTNQKEQINFSSASSVEYHKLRAIPAKQFCDIEFTMPNLTPNTLYKFDVWIEHTVYIWFSQKTCKCSIEFKTPAETFGSIREPITRSDLQVETAVTDFDDQNEKPRVMVIGAEAHGKSTCLTNFFKGIGLPSIEARQRSVGLGLNGHGNGKAKGTTGLAEYVTPTITLLEYQGAKDAPPHYNDISTNSTWFKILDLAIRGHVSSFNYEPDKKYEELIKEMKGNLFFPKQPFNKVVNCIIVVISVEEDAKMKEGIKLFQLINETHPLIPKFIVTSKLDILSQQTMNHSLRLDHGDIINRIASLSKNCGVLPQQIYPAFPPLTVGEKVPEKLEYYSRKLVNDIHRRVKATTQEIINSERVKFFLTVVNGNESKEIEVTKSEYANYGTIVQKIKKECNLSHNIYLFQIIKTKVTELKDSHQLDFFRLVYIGREFTISNFSILNEEIRIRSPIQYLHYMIAETVHIAPKKLCLYSFRDGVHIRIKTIPNDFNGTIYYDTAESLKPIDFYVTYNKTEILVNSRYINEDEELETKLIFEKFKLPEKDKLLYHFVASRNGKDFQVTTYGDLLRSDKKTRDGKVVLLLKRIDDKKTTMLEFKALFKRGDKFIPYSIRYNDKHDCVSVSMLASYLPNENLSQLCLMGKIAGCYCVIDSVEFALECDEKNGFKMLEIVNKV